MKCCLCQNTDNLLIQVQAGSGLSLHLCPEHENTPLFEVAARLAAENERLREALEHYTDLRPFACDSSCWCANPNTGMTARQALEERDE